MLRNTAAAGVVLGCALATQVAAHTNSVGFIITPSSATSCVGSGGSECYDVEVFFGSWHAGSISPEGNLALFEITGSGETQVVGPTVGGSTPFSMNHSLTGTVPNSGSSTTYDYSVQGSADQANLQSVFSFGSNYFFDNYTSALQATSAGSNDIHAHQSAVGAALPPGTYRIDYDAIGFPTTATWEPRPAILTATFTILSGGGIVVDTGGAPNVTLTAPPAPSGPFTVTATFSEDVTGVELSDFTVAGGSPSNLVQVAPNVYTITITPSGTDPITVDMPANSAIDTDSNGNNASNTLSVTPGAPAGLTAEQIAEIVNTAQVEELKTIRSQVATDRRMVRAARDRFLQAQRCNADFEEELTEQERLECDVQVSRNTPLDVDGFGTISGERALLNGTFFAQSAVKGNKRRLVFGDFDVVHHKSVGTTASLEGRVAWEQMLSDKAMFGYFLGGQLAHSSVSTTFSGDRSRVGLAAGLYGVRDLGNDLTADGFLTASLGYNDIDMTDGVVDVDGDYKTKSLQFGAALSGRREFNGFDLLPEIAFFGGYSDLGDLSIDASTIGFSSVVDLDGGHVAFGVLSLTPEFVIPAKFTSSAWSSGEYRISPSLICEVVRAGTQSTNCGGALELEMSADSDDGLSSFAARLRTERVGSAQRNSASVTFEHNF